MKACELLACADALLVDLDGTLAPAARPAAIPAGASRCEPRTLTTTCARARS
jgi:hypothetical protein